MKTTRLVLTCSIAISFFLFFACENEPIDTPDFNQEATIEVNSELYNLIRRVAEVPENDLDTTKVSCVKFVYPLTIFTFDDNNAYQSIHMLNSDAEFSTLLGQLTSEQAISISYPIESTLEDGTQLTINSNDALKEAIDNCIKDVLLGASETLINSCFWKVVYSEHTNNTYAGALFQGQNGATNFSFDDTHLIGSWSPLFIEDELHLNIHLNSEDATSNFWNRDWIVTYLSDTEMRLDANNTSVILRQFCTINQGCVNTGLDFLICHLDNIEVTEIVLADHTSCLLDAIYIDAISNSPENITTTYYSTAADAQDQTNVLDELEPYVVADSQITFWLRVENTTTYSIIPITFNFIFC
ncbi:MAG: hypothetical protein GYB39_05495 [Algicola sp.]|nr:hypothetical protein [Algicola sp.]